MKLYLIKYSANEFDTIGYSFPYPVFYSLDKDKTRLLFENKRNEEIERFNNFLEKFPQYKDDNDYYQIAENSENVLEIYYGNWFYEWNFEEVELDQIDNI